jgi:hypothetical protein
LVLKPAGNPITYLHHRDEMVPLADDGRLASLAIQPKDQALFDKAADSFLQPASASTDEPDAKVIAIRS